MQLYLKDPDPAGGSCSDFGPYYATYSSDANTPSETSTGDVDTARSAMAYYTKYHYIVLIGQLA